MQKFRKSSARHMLKTGSFRLRKSKNSENENKGNNQEIVNDSDYDSDCNSICKEDTEQVIVNEDQILKALDANTQRTGTPDAKPKVDQKPKHRLAPRSFSSTLNMSTSSISTPVKDSSNAPTTPTKDENIATPIENSRETPTGESDDNNPNEKELKDKVKWLEFERVRLLQLSRNGSSRSLLDKIRDSPKKSKRKKKLAMKNESSARESIESTKSTSSNSNRASTWKEALKYFNVTISLVGDQENTSPEAVEKQVITLDTLGVKVAEEKEKLVVKEFVRDEDGNPRYLEASGHVGADDAITQINGKAVASLQDIAEALAEVEGNEVELEFSRSYVQQPKVDKTMSIKELLGHITELEKQLKKAQKEYKRLDIGALEGLQFALDDSQKRVRELEAELEHLRSQETISEREAELLRKYELKARECRKLYNTLMDLKGAIRVFVRVRPTEEGEPGDKGAKSVMHCRKDARSLVISDFETQDVPEKAWEFDAVFAPKATQKNVYSEVEPLVFSVVDGYNACVFAYGQTGSGKTYTMDGPDTDRGVYFRATETLFEAIEKRKKEVNDDERIEFSVKVSVLEIYQERVRDLLSPALAEGYKNANHQILDDATNSISIKQPHSLEIMHHPKSGYVYVQGAQEHTATNAFELHEIIESGKKHRVVGVTNMNERSSRSHMVLIVHVVSRLFKNDVPKAPVKSKLQLIDLAGSERADPNFFGERHRETGSINKSLSALGDVMHALQNEDSRHIPFRNSKLTSLLRDSLGGQARTLMLVQVSPLRRHMNESIRTLEFAQRASRICLGGADRNSEGRQQLSRMKKENIELNNEIHRIRTRLLSTKEERDKAEKREHALQEKLDAKQKSHAEESQKWKYKQQALETEIVNLQRQQRDALRKEKEDNRVKKEVEKKRAQSENQVAQDELKNLRSRNTDLRRENQELASRVQALENKLEHFSTPNSIPRNSSFRMSMSASSASRNLMSDASFESPRRAASTRRMTGTPPVGSSGLRRTPSSMSKQ